jgi:hypothetical protein
MANGADKVFRKSDFEARNQSTLGGFTALRTLPESQNAYGYLDTETVKDNAEVGKGDKIGCGKSSFRTQTITKIWSIRMLIALPKSRFGHPH